MKNEKKKKVSGDDPLTKPVRDKGGKFKKAEEPAAEQKGYLILEKEPEERPLIKTRVAGQSTKLAAIQTHNLKFNGIGEPLPELIEGEDEDE